MFLRTKKFKGRDGSLREYLFIVENVRKEGKTAQITRGSLGRLDLLRDSEQLHRIIEKLCSYSKQAELLKINEANLGSKWSKLFGPLLIFRKLWEELGFSEMLVKYLQERKYEANVAEAILAMVVNRLVEPKSKLGTHQWIENVYEERWAGLELQHFYRAMDFLGEKKEEMEQEIFWKVANLFNQELDLILFDTTSIIYRGKGEEAEELVEYGFSKERRSDLKQIVIGILLTKDGLAVGHEVYSGSTNDVVAFEKIIEKVKKRFKLGRIIFVCDRGNVSKKNIKFLEDSGYEYILGVRMRKLKPEDRADFLKEVGFKTVKETLKVKEIIKDNRKYIVCINPEEAREDKEKREEIIERLKEKLKTMGLKSLLINREYAKYLKIEAKKPEIDEEKVKQEEIYDGKYILMTNAAISSKDTVSSYKGLWQVESAFRDLKDELEIAPIYHFTESRIRSHVFICFLALILKLTLKRKLKEVAPDLSYTQVLEDVKKIRANEFRINRHRIILRTDLQGKASVAFKAVGLKPPAQILDHISPK